MRKEANTSAKSGLRTECLQPRGSVQCSLACSSVSTPKPGQLSPVLTPRTTGVIGTVPWVLDKCLREDWGSWTTEKRLQRMKMKGGDTPNRPISKPLTDVAGRTMCY